MQLPSPGQFSATKVSNYKILLHMRIVAFCKKRIKLLIIQDSDVG